MRKIISSIVSVFLFVCSSCKQQRNFAQAEPQEVVDLTGVPIPIESMGFSFIDMMDNKILVQNLKDEFIFNLYETDSFRLKDSFGSIGDGPTEFRSVRSTAPRVGQHVAKRSMIVHDIERNRLVNIRMKEKNPSQTVVYETNGLPRNTLFDGPRTVIHFSDSLYIYMPRSNGARMVISNLKTSTDRVIDYSTFPSGKVVDNEILHMMFYDRAMINFDDHLIVLAPLGLGQLDFFDFEGEFIRTVIYDNHNHLSEFLKTPFSELGDIKRYAWEIKATSDAFYVLVSNIPLIGAEPMSNYKSSILKFDWEGNFLVEYRLDRHASSFALDQVKSKIYLYNADTESQVFYSYSLNP